MPKRKKSSAAKLRLSSGIKDVEAAAFDNGLRLLAKLIARAIRAKTDSK